MPKEQRPDAKSEGGNASDLDLSQLKRRVAELAALVGLENGTGRPTQSKIDFIISHADQFRYYGEEESDAKKRGASIMNPVAGRKLLAEITDLPEGTCKDAIRKRRIQLGLTHEKPNRKRRREEQKAHNGRIRDTHLHLRKVHDRLQEIQHMEDPVTMATAIGALAAEIAGYMADLQAKEQAATGAEMRTARRKRSQTR